MQENITFIFETYADKNAFSKCCDTPNIQRTSIGYKNLLIRNRKTLNNEVGNILTLLISGGTLAAIIGAIKEVVIKYLDMGKTTIVIQRGDRKLEIKYDNRSNDVNMEDIVSDELIKELFFSENAEEEASK